MLWGEVKKENLWDGRKREAYTASEPHTEKHV
jgi:hypothetical protein